VEFRREAVLGMINTGDQLLRTGLPGADDEGLTRVPLKLFSEAEQDELLSLLHAYLWDPAAPHDEQWHRSPGKIMTLWSVLEV